MKKQLFLTIMCIVCALFIRTTAVAQGVAVYKKNGDVMKVPYEELDSIVTYIIPPNNVVQGHEYVDLGLSVKWATCNVGADSPENYGNYYAWGETVTKNEYNFDTYKYYNNNTGCVNLGSNISGTQYDVAYVKWGGSWRMPTLDEIKELIDNCTWEWTTYNGVSGALVTASNGNSIFLPAAGYRSGLDFSDCGLAGRYWSATSDKKDNNFARGLIRFSGSSGNYIYSNTNRGLGLTVRPVTE